MPETITDAAPAGELSAILDGVYDCAPAAGRLGMQAQQQAVQGRVVPRGRGHFVDLRQAVIGDGLPGRGQPPRLGHLPRRVLPGSDQVVVFGMPVHTPQSGDQVLLRAAPATGVAAAHHMGLDVGHEMPDVGRSGLIETAGAPLLDDPVPVRAIRPPGPRRHGRRHGRDVFGKCRNLRPFWGNGYKIGGSRVGLLWHVSQASPPAVGRRSVTTRSFPSTCSDGACLEAGLIGRRWRRCDRYGAADYHTTSSGTILGSPGSGCIPGRHPVRSSPVPCWHTRHRRGLAQRPGRDI